MLPNKTNFGWIFSFLLILLAFIGPTLSWVNLKADLFLEYTASLWAALLKNEGHVYTQDTEEWTVKSEWWNNKVWIQVFLFCKNKILCAPDTKTQT